MTNTEREGEKEREKEGKRKHALLTREKSDDELTHKIFVHWQEIMCYPSAKLDRKRKKLLRNALHLGYTHEQLCQAIQGCRLTPHNMGKNDKGERYDALHIIFRDRDQIDRFIRNSLHPPVPLQKSMQRMQDNANTVRAWLEESTDTPEEGV